MIKTFSVNSRLVRKLQASPWMQVLQSWSFPLTARRSLMWFGVLDMFFDGKKERKKLKRLIILTFWYLSAAHHKFVVLMNSFYLNLNAAPSLPMLMILKKDWPLFDAYNLENLEQNLVGCKLLQKVICMKMPRVALFVLHIFHLWEKKVCILKDILILYLQLVLSASFLKLNSFFYSTLLG